MTPLRPSPDDRLTPLLRLGLRHRQTPQERPPAPKQPQPWVDLVHVAPPTAIHSLSGRICDPVLKRAGLQVPQLVRYCRNSVALQETGKEWHPAKHKFAGSNVQDRSRGRLAQLGGGTIHRACGGGVAGNLSSSKVLKNTRVASKSSGPRASVTCPAGIDRKSVV